MADNQMKDKLLASQPAPVSGSFPAGREGEIALLHAGLHSMTDTVCHKPAYCATHRAAEGFLMMLDAFRAQSAPVSVFDDLYAIEAEMTDALVNGALVNPEMFGWMLKGGDNPILRWRDRLSAFLSRDDDSGADVLSSTP